MFTIPNEASVIWSDQAEPDKVDIDILVAGIKGDGVISGCAVSQRAAGANMSVDVAAGTVKVGAVQAAVAGGNVAVGAADATYPRFDLVEVSSAGAVSIKAGTPAANPVFPSITASRVVLAAIYVPANYVVVLDNQIVDKRVEVVAGDGAGAGNVRWRNYANHPALQTETDHVNNDLAWVINAIFIYSSASMAVATSPDSNGSTVIKPNDVPVDQPGRWLRVAPVLTDGTLGLTKFAAAAGLMSDLGKRYINVLRLGSDVADGETVTIGAFTFEFDNNDDFNPANYQVDVQPGVTPALAGEALAETINTQAAGVLRAVQISDNEVLVASDVISSGSALACSETMGGANNEWAAANMYGGAAPATKNMSSAARVPNDTEVALGKMHFYFGFTPSVVQVQVRVTATGVVKAWDGAVSINGERVTLDNSGGTDWANTDTVHVMVTA
jgi:hypothetical protein